jgi:hypothetical protein
MIGAGSGVDQLTDVLTGSSVPCGRGTLAGQALDLAATGGASPTAPEPPLLGTPRSCRR